MIWMKNKKKKAEKVSLPLWDIDATAKRSVSFTEGTDLTTENIPDEIKKDMIANLAQAAEQHGKLAQKILDCTGLKNAELKIFCSSVLDFSIEPCALNDRWNITLFQKLYFNVEIDDLPDNYENIVKVSNCLYAFVQILNNTDIQNKSELINIVVNLITGTLNIEISDEIYMIFDQEETVKCQ